MKTSGWLRRSVAALIITCFVPVATTACFGKFQLVQKVYKFNKEVDPDKWVQWFVFLVLSIIPIYGLATVIDVVLANSVEFWTGENPITADVGATKMVRGPNGEMLRLTRLADGSVSVVVEQDGKTLASFNVRPDGNSLAAWDSNGNLIARVGDLGGQPAMLGGAALAH